MKISTFWTVSKWKQDHPKRLTSRSSNPCAQNQAPCRRYGAWNCGQRRQEASTHLCPAGSKVNTECYIDLLRPICCPGFAGTIQKAIMSFNKMEHRPTPPHLQEDSGLVGHQPGRLLGQVIVLPPSSPDLNPLDYSVWGVLESKACKNSHNR
jgi:hypothetical protein